MERVEDQSGKDMVLKVVTVSVSDLTFDRKSILGPKGILVERYHSLRSSVLFMLLHSLYSLLMVDLRRK